MEVFILTEVTYDYYSFPEVYGVFESVEKAKEFVGKLRHKHNWEYQIYDLTDDSVDIESTIESLRIAEKSHWEISRFILNEGEVQDDDYWSINND